MTVVDDHLRSQRSRGVIVDTAGPIGNILRERIVRSAADRPTLRNLEFYAYSQLARWGEPT
jgi:hypothetical protein